MSKLRIDKILITDRARKELGDDISDLKASIERRGLFNPIIVSKENLGLVAGFRRIHCFKELGLKEIDVKFYEDLTALDKKLIELEENIHKELTWDERANLRAQIHRLYQEQHGKAKAGKGSKKGQWGLEDTAEVLNVSQATISQDMALVDAIGVMPALKGISSRRQALKAVDRIKEVAILSELAVRDAENAQGLMRSMPHVLLHGDATTLIKEKIEDEVIDLVIFDPPWGINIHRIASSRGPRGEKTSYHDDTWGAATEFIEGILPELFRVMKPDAQMYMFMGIQDREYWIDVLTGYTNMLEKVISWATAFPDYAESLAPFTKFIVKKQNAQAWGFHVEEIPLIWVKEGGGFTDFEFKFMPRYESMLFCSKGKPKPLNDPTSNVFEYNRPVSTERYHTQEKSIDLITKLIKISSQPNEIILDPCAGSFVTSVAATLSGRRSIAIDNDEECYTRGLARISGMIIDNEEDEESDE